MSQIEMKVEEGKKKPTFSIAMIGGLISATIMLLSSILVVFNWMISSELKPIHSRLDAIELMDTELQAKHDNILVHYKEKIDWINETVVIRVRNDAGKMEIQLDINKRKIEKLEESFNDVILFKSQLSQMEKEIQELKQMMRR